MVGASVALVPPRSSVLPPGAGNEEPQKVLKADKQRAKEIEEGSGSGSVIHGQVHAAAIRRDNDGDAAAI